MPVAPGNPTTPSPYVHVTILEHTRYVRVRVERLAVEALADKLLDGSADLERMRRLAAQLVARACRVPDRQARRRERALVTAAERIARRALLALKVYVVAPGVTADLCGRCTLRTLDTRAQRVAGLKHVPHDVYAQVARAHRGGGLH